MSGDVAYCEDCGARLDLYVVGVCSRCHFDLTGEDEARAEREAIDRALGGGAESPREGTEA